MTSVAGSTSDVPSGVRAAWLSLLDDAEAIADDITLTLLERDAEGYARVGPGLRAEVRSSTREHVRRGIETFAGLGDAGQSVADLWRETGRRRARQGVPMELVLGAYTLGSRVLWRALVDRGRTAGLAPWALLEAGQEVWSALDVQSAVMVSSYRQESIRLQRRDLRLQQGVLDALLDGRGAEPAVAEEARQVLDLPPSADVACLVALPGAGEGEPLAGYEDRLDRWELTACWFPRGDRWCGLVAGALISDAVVAEVIAPWARTRIGVAMSADGLPGFATAYQLAARAAETLPPDSNGAAAVTERLPEVLVAGGGPVTTLLVRETLGPLLAQRPALRDTLVTTLDALLRCGGSPTRAAEELFCHRNTVIYRMRQIAQLTGCDLAEPRDTLLLTLAMLAQGSR